MRFSFEGTAEERFSGGDQAGSPYLTPAQASNNNSRTAARCLFNDDDHHHLHPYDHDDEHTRGKRHSTPATLVWMDEHYHLVEGVCIPR